MLRRLLSALAPLEWRVFVTALLVLAVFAQPGSADGKRTLELAESIAVDHSLRLDGVVVRDGYVKQTTSPDGRFPPPVGEAHDRSFYQGHYFIGVAPGLGILALPSTIVLEKLGERAAPAAWKSRFVRHGILDLATVYSVMLPITLLTLFFVLRTHEKLFGDRRLAAILTLVYAFGTLSFFYGVQSSAWQIINAVSWAFVYFALLPERPVPNVTALALGAAGALGASMNYFGAIVMPVFGMTLLLRRDLRAVVWLSLGFALGLLPLMAYHWAVFDNPLSTSYSHRIDAGVQKLMASGFQGFHPPSPRIALELLIHPYYGLFVYAPVTALSVVGVWKGRRNAVLWFGLGGALLILAMVSGRWDDYHSGEGGYGSRYLAPMLPFVWLLVLAGLKKVPPLALELVALFSVIISTFGAMFGAKWVHLSISQFLIRGLELPTLGWLRQVLEEHSTRRPPVSASGIIALLAIGLWLVWRRRPVLEPWSEPPG